MSEIRINAKNVTTAKVMEHSKTTGRVYLKGDWIGKTVLIIEEDKK